ncbi:MAG: FtsW/RodA/SpoVE family cell cycle protein [Candidatus Pacebacteria bacterium]|nr:FtsW/RodA/SpoVE family cell cycle protein [Candidatus Paceibacterota bacterium]MBP9867179.1 FtsW/RodA/SpoVE family cell cycle protein [Candidatus Paceibacterota bacterium]
MFKYVDKVLLITVILLLATGLVIFGSAALGVLAVNEAKFYSIIKTQLIYALIGGGIALYIGTAIPYEFYKKHAFLFFGIALAVTSLVFVPFFSRYHGGAHRWIDIGSFTVQPSEMLKFTFVAVVAYWCSTYRNMFKNWKYGLLPYMVSAGLVTVILLAQPDFGTYLIIITASFITYFVGGARKKHIQILFLAGVIGFVLLIAVRPYMLERLKTFFDSSHDPRGSSWQLNQSLIALGGGGLTGRGLGQSVQKFNYLPEPIGDSIFAVLGEELGFIGALYIILLYGIVGARGYFIFKESIDPFGRLLAVGIVSIILAQATLNIGSMLGVFPLSGVPMPLVSHGGTALMVTLFELGVLLNISKSIRTYL